MDVSEFQAHLAALRNHNHTALLVDCQECLAHLQTVTLLYRGDFLSGFRLRDSPGFEDWQFFQAEDLRREYASSLQKLANLLFQKGSFVEAAMFAQRWLALDNLNEEAHRLLMKIFNLADSAIWRYANTRNASVSYKRSWVWHLRQPPGCLHESISSGDVIQGREIPSERL